MKKSLSFFLGAALLLLSVASFAQDCGYGMVLQNGVCRNTRTVSTAPAPFVAVPVRNADNIMLYPTATPSSCASSSQQDSNCTVVYTYTDPNPPPTITASFSNPSPVATVSGTSPIWNSTNAVTVVSSCSGVAGSTSGSVALQGNPSGLTFNSSIAGVQICTYTATNSIGLTATATATATFVLPAPPVPLPTIKVTRTPAPLVAGSSYTVTWASTNATSVSYVCTSTGTGFAGSAPTAINGSATGTAPDAWVGYPSTCVWTATGPGGSASTTETITTVAAPAVLSGVYRFRDTTSHYFWTAGVAERDSLLAASWYWIYEGPAFNAYPTSTAPSGSSPVYRFANDSGGHYYTISLATRDWVIANLPSYHYEGIAWYAMSTNVAGTVPLYQFYNTNNGTHFYTASVPERDYVLQNIPSWTYEGVVQYVW